LGRGHEVAQVSDFAVVFSLGVRHECKCYPCRHSFGAVCISLVENAC
jgi:hypothetical protein